ncbi:hypothetical protein HMPREF9123_2579 [Neisseria bacilliformis ATCC BAA-1200]|uniref:Uncharacterized protein n=1 Tax=Neisseria bacilliformis ATCC BAA-1200 TaxID=888742 RepID=F2BFS2_9NEIS|nr:hypothetical protein HMPREF9123_2579 [Neisseria bacilliformis ATCC BAA-1200]
MLQIRTLYLLFCFDFTIKRPSEKDNYVFRRPFWAFQATQPNNRSAY